MSEDEIIACGKEEEEILRSNEWNLIGGIRKFNKENRVSTYVSYLKGIYNASTPPRRRNIITYRSCTLCRDER